MKIICAAIILLMSFTSFSQNKNTFPDFDERKSTLGIDISPAIIALMAANTYVIHTGVMHKYYLGNKFQLRNSFNYRYTKSIFSILQNPYLDYEKNDTLFYKRSYTNSNSFLFRSGFQYNFSKTRVQPFVGAEILAGVRISHTDIYQYQVPVYVGTDGEKYVSAEADPLNKNYIDEYNHYFNSGLSLLAGIDWFLSQRISLGTQMNFDFMLSHLYKKETITTKPNLESDLTVNKNVSTHYDFQMTPLRIFLNFTL